MLLQYEIKYAIVSGDDFVTSGVKLWQVLNF